MPFLCVGTRYENHRRIVTIQTWYFSRHCEERSDEAIHFRGDYRLLRFARNDENTAPLNCNGELLYPAM
jgi:hypothetical protein